MKENNIYLYSNLKFNSQTAKIERWCCAFNDYPHQNCNLNIKPVKTLIYILHNYFCIEDINTGNLILNEQDVHKFNINKIDIFDDEKECIEYYNKSVYEVMDKYYKEIETMKSKMEKFENNFIGTDFIMEKLRRS